MGEQLPEYSFAQIQKQSCWIVYDGLVYDTTNWLPKHPGGLRSILDVSGSNITNILDALHPLGTEKILKRQCAVVRKVLGSTNSDTPQLSAFFKSLKERVSAYTLGRKKNTTTLQVVIACIVFSCVVASWYMAYFMASCVTTQIAAAALFGMFLTQCLLSIGHDVSHGSLKLNGVLTMAELITGFAEWKWNLEHNIGHHFSPNVRHEDNGIGTKDGPIRLAPTFKWFPIHRLQYVLLPLLTPFLTLRHRIKDFIFFLSFNSPRDVRSTRPPQLKHRLRYILVILIGHYGYRIALPFLLSANRPMLVFFVSEMVMSIYSYNVFSVSHLFDGATFPTAVTDDWALHILRTTLDYGTDSTVTRILTGALNYQTAHHFFPLLAQEHYPEVTKILVATCREFGYPYQCVPSFWHALVLHYRHLMRMGSATM